jgi:glycosyltransferase involved in cell wall biosynthesis
MNEGRTGLLVINGPLRPALGGIASYLTYVLPYLVEKGMDVHTVIDRRPDDPTLHESYAKKGLHIHYCPASRRAIVLLMLKHVRLWLQIVRQSRLRPLDALKCYKSIVRWIDVSENVLRNYRIDIIHAYDYPWVQGWVAQYLARKYHKSYFQTTYGEVTPHQSEVVLHDRQSARHREFVRTVLKQADVLMSCSKHCAREVEYVGIDPSAVKVVYHGIDMDVFRSGLDSSNVRSRYQLGDNRIVLYVGQIRQRKGPQVLLESVPTIVRQFPSAVVCYAGPDHGMVGRLQERSRELNVETNVRFLGSVEDAVLPNLYNACDVFVFPSCTPIECLGLSTIQAMACGKPVVGSRINGVPEVIVDEVTGFLVEPNDPTALATKINALLGDRALWNRMGSEGVKRAHAMFDQRMLGDELYGMYASSTR